VIAHETTHALVHGARERFMEPTNPDTAAFHEAFADLVAMLQHFSLPGVVESAIQQTRASLDDIKPLVQLGRQLIEAVGARGALRAALGEPPNPRMLLRTYEAHERGAILVAAVFSAMLQVYRRRSADLLRIATGGTGVLPPGHIAADLVHRLAGEARKTASHFLNMCIRAIDYCPPIDIDFGEFLRAVITVDRELEPADPLQYRAALIEAFRERGILPRGVFSLAESSVMWNACEGKPDTRGLRFDSIRFHRAQFETRTPPHYFRMFQDFVTRKRNMPLFRLDPRQRTEVVSVQPLRRIGPDRRIHDEVVVEVIQTGGRLSTLPGAPPYRGGSTLVVGRDGQVRYVIYKPFAMRERKERQREYLANLAVAAGAHAYVQPRLRLSLAGIHRGI
jgi:hypothetical protein